MIQIAPQVAVAMFGYMTDLDTVEDRRSEEITAEGDDMESLLFHFLDEFLFLFSADPFFVPKVTRPQGLHFQLYIHGCG